MTIADKKLQAKKDYDAVYDTGVYYGLLRTLAAPLKFNINGRKFCTEKGTTWEQWIASPYNTKGYFIVLNDNKVYDPASGATVKNSGIDVIKTNVIVDKATYTV